MVDENFKLFSVTGKTGSVGFFIDNKIPIEAVKIKFQNFRPCLLGGRPFYIVEYIKRHTSMLLIDPTACCKNRTESRFWNVHFA